LSDVVAPDLELKIGLDRSAIQPTLRFELHGADPRLGIRFQRFEDRVLSDDPTQLLKGFADRAAAQGIFDRLHPFLDFGAYLYELLIPEALRTILEAHLDPIRSLQIQSEEPWIPWEMILLRSGSFLCEAFDLTRWLGARPQPLRFPFEEIALVAPRDSELDVDDEIRFLEELAGPTRRIDRITALPGPVREACATGRYDVLHFSGHGRATQVADRAEIRLEERTVFSPLNLYGQARRLGARRPLVVLNGCHTGRGGFSLTGLGGWAKHLLAIGCGGFAGTHWAVDSDKAGLFARSFYGGLLEGLPMGRAFRQARAAVRSETDPSWLAYTLYAHPAARLGPVGPQALFVSAFNPERREPVLELPEPRPPRPNPASVLRAEHQVVPFHGRDRELAELYEWCTSGAPAAARLYTGAGGMGKTRLALEIARHLRDEGWQAGLLAAGDHDDTRDEDAEAPWNKLVRSGRPALIVMDYAESRRPFLVSLLRKMKDHAGRPVRLLLLARGARDWWTRLKTAGGGVGEFLQGPSTQVRVLSPLALTVEEKSRSYRMAAEAFTEVLEQSIPMDPPENLEAPFFDRVLLLHMSALVGRSGKTAASEEEILDSILLRERRFWERRIADWNLPPTIAPGLGRALALITLSGGAASESTAVTALRKLRFFQDREQDVLVSVVRLLRECYPGKLWIEPLQPDTLGLHLYRRELEDGADELLALSTGIDGEAGSDTDEIEGIG